MKHFGIHVFIIGLLYYNASKRGKSNAYGRRELEMPMNLMLYELIKHISFYIM